MISFCFCVIHGNRNSSRYFKQRRLNTGKRLHYKVLYRLEMKKKKSRWCNYLEIRDYMTALPAGYGNKGPTLTEAGITRAPDGAEGHWDCNSHYSEENQEPRSL